MSFGKMSIANGFLTKADFKNEYFFNLEVGFCQNCYMVQLTELVDRNKMFHDNYAFYSSTSRGMADHFKEMAEDVIGRYGLGTESFIVELGSNDGIMLKHFAERLIPHLGVEPSSNVANIAQGNGINTMCAFFDEKVAQDIVSEYGKADMVLGANVMCHIPNIHSVVSGIKLLLKTYGLLIFEDPYLGEMLKRTSYDQIYDEHAFYFSLASLSWLFKQHGMEIISVEPQNVHGGSMRYTVANIGEYAVTPSVESLIDNEKFYGFHFHETYDSFRDNVKLSRSSLISLLHKIKKDRKRVVGYAATSKSTTVLNYCGIGTDLIEFISDTTPIKQGKFSPGMHIPVRPYENFTERYPDYALLFAWNHMKEVMDKESNFSLAGGKWITFVPEVRIMS